MLPPRRLLLAAVGLVASVAAYPALDGSNHGIGGGVSSVNAAASAFALRGNYYADGVDQPRSLPSARALSNSVFAGGPTRDNERGLSMLAASFWLFVLEDLALPEGTAVNATSPDMLHVPVPACDRRFDPGCSGAAELLLPRGVYDPSTGTSAANPRRQLNMQTGWLDGSAIYGATPARSIALRSFRKGLLLEESANGVPTNSHCAAMAGPASTWCSQRLTGDVRGNAFPGVLALHGLWVKEHNRRARALAVAHPAWGDEQLFQEARKRVVAALQAITYYELLPALVDRALSRYGGYNASVDARLDASFAVAAAPFVHSSLSSVALCVLPSGQPCASGHLLLRDSYYRPRALDDWGVGIGDLLRGMVLQPAGAVGPGMVADARDYYEGSAQDLAVVDIMRGRDFGLPSFAEARRALGLGSTTGWADVTTDARVQSALQAVYGGRVQDVELWVGGLAESAVAATLLGPTFKALVRDQMGRLRDGDWFWFENVNATYPDGSRYMSDDEVGDAVATSLADVIVRNTDWAQPPLTVFHAVSRMLAVVPTATPAAASSIAAVSPTSSPSVGSGTATPTPSASLPSGGGTGTAAAAVARSVTLNSVLSLTWFPPATGDTAITLTFKFTGSGWFGWCLDTASMLQADTWLMRYVGGQADAVDSYSGSYSSPTRDAVQDVSVVSASSAGGVITMTVRRALQTSEAADATFRSGPMDVLLAWHPTNTAFGYHAGNTLAVAIDFFKAAAGANSTGNGTAADEGVTLIDTSSALSDAMISAYGVHGLTMILMYGVLMPVAVAAMRFLKHVPAHLVFHKFAMVRSRWLGDAGLRVAAAAACGGTRGCG
jgi:hypothetical protein